MDPDRIWTVVNLLSKSIHSYKHVLPPSIFLTEEVTQEDFDTLCKVTDTFEEFVQFLSSVPWEQDGFIPLKATVDFLHTSLRALERVDVEAREIESSVNIITQLHSISIRQEGGPYPNDLSFAVSHQLLRCSSSLLHSMDQYRSCVRERIQTLVRKRLRPLTVLDLPDELLIQIFSHVRGHLFTIDAFSTFFTGHVRDIQNVRLTCQRFCGASSHLLFNRVSVDLRPESLSQLEEISRHPTIGKGVRSVRLQLLFYHSELSNDLRRFAEVWSLRLAHDMDYLMIAARRPRSLASLYEDLSHADVDPILEKCSSVLEAWEHFAHSGEDLPGSEAFVEALRTAHREYQRLFDIQTRLLEDRGFTQAFAGAIARMPHAKSLVIEDGIASSSQPFYKGINEPNALCRTYLEALSTRSADLYGLGLNFSMDLVLNILAAIPGAGASLRGVKIDIACAGDTALLASSPSTRRHISVLSKQLGSAFIRFGKLQQGSSANTRSGFYQLLLVILDTDSLERINLDLGDIKTEESSPFNIGPVLNRQKRPNLSNLSLRGVAFHATELELFTGSLRPRGYLGNYLESSYFRGVHFHLTGLRLLSGTWMGVLDLLRAKSGNFSSIDGLSGAECEDMSKEEYDRVFTRPVDRFGSSSWKKPSLAEEYVGSHYCNYPNPLRVD
ncbi:hypothetical protein F4677DRAFT_100698 [Hypoxylon crocopeplum]|nr:hypothetical protein F4677DRAFT_100698 [Hypoxylon crocopeplum]